MWDFLTAFSSCSIHRESLMRGGFRGPLAPPFRREISSANFWGELGRGDSGLKSFFTPAIFEFFFTGNANLLVSFLSAPPPPRVESDEISNLLYFEESPILKLEIGLGGTNQKKKKISQDHHILPKPHKDDLSSFFFFLFRWNVRS